MKKLFLVLLLLAVAAGCQKREVKVVVDPNCYEYGYWKYREYSCEPESCWIPWPPESCVIETLRTVHTFVYRRITHTGKVAWEKNKQDRILFDSTEVVPCHGCLDSL